MTKKKTDDFEVAMNATETNDEEMEDAADVSEPTSEKNVAEIPAPEDNDDKPLRALVFDSIYDSYRGVIVYVRIVDGKIKAGDAIFKD